MIRTARERGIGCGGLTFTVGMIAWAAVFGIGWLLEGHPPEHWKTNLAESIVFLFACAAVVEMYVQLDRAIDHATREIKKAIEQTGDEIKAEIRNLKP